MKAETIGLVFAGEQPMLAADVADFLREQNIAAANVFVSAVDGVKADVAKFKQFTNVQFSV